MTKITGYTALVAASAQTDDVVPIVDVHDTSMAASGTTKKITLANLLETIDNDTDTNIKQDGAQASGTVNLAADAGHVHPAYSWIPSDNGLLAANAPLPCADGGVITNSGNLYLQKIWIRQPFTATHLWVNCSTLGAGASTQSFCGIWNSSGTLLTGSADIGSSFISPATTGPVSVNWTTPQALTVGMNWVWVGFVFNLATTQPTLRTLTANNPTIMNTNLANTAYAVVINGTSVTALANITPSNNNVTGTAIPYWVGIS